MKRLRIIPWILGIAVIVTTLAGANRLLHPTDTAASAAPAAPAVATTEGLVAKGTVQSDPPVVEYSLPAHLPAGTIVEVFVINGQSVKVGDPLIRYDDTLLQKDKIKAELAYNLAVQDHNSAVAKLNVHGTTIELAKLAVKDAELKLAQAQEALDLAHKAFNRDFDIRMPNMKPEEKTPEARQREMNEYAPYVLARNQLANATNLVAKSKIDQQAAELGLQTLKEIVGTAKFHAALVDNDVKKAEQAIKDCTLVAKAEGTIEQVTAAVGQTVRAQQPRPLLYLVPSGKRIVVAEIVPDFAYKIAGRIGQVVEITDDSHTAFKYSGKVKRVSGAFLPKANGVMDLTGKPNAVLNVEIEVTDASPSGMPPLRVGQPVRVSFP